MSAPGANRLGPYSMGTPLTVEEIDHRTAFRALAPAWEALARQAGSTGPFFHPYWFAVYAADLARERRGAVENSPFGAGTDRSLRLLVAHRRGQLAGVLPLVAERRRIAGVPVRVLRSLSDDHSQRFDVLAAQGQDGEEAIDALWRALASDHRWDVLELRDLPPGSHGEKLIARAEAEGFPTGTWASLNSPYLPLPDTEKALEAALDGKFKANLRRRGRRLAEEVGPLRLEHVRGGPELSQALTDGFALEASGWKGAGGTAIAQDARLDARYRSLARVFAERNELSLFFLRAGERRVAFHFAIEANDVYYLFKPGYDEALAKYGLGHLLFMEVAKALIARGCNEIDFLGDDMPWKRDWTDKLRPHAFRYVMRKTPTGRALAAWKFRGLPAVRELADKVSEKAGTVRGALAGQIGTIGTVVDSMLHRNKEAAEAGESPAKPSEGEAK